MDPSTRVISVEINGQRYPVRSSLDEAYVMQLAAYVDAKMRAAAQEAPTGDTLRIAVLAALNIADEYFRSAEPDERASAREELRRRTERLERLVDGALAGRETPAPSAD
jgi:cell division protein ZapA